MSQQFLTSMMIKQIQKLPITVLAVLLIFQKCNCTKDLRMDCAEVRYSFPLPVIGYPQKDTVIRGDTLWLEIKESTSFIDERSGNTIDYSSAANLGSAIGFQIYDSVEKNWFQAVDSFSFKLISGTQYSKGLLYVEYLFKEEAGHYLFKIAVIPSSKGLYRLVFSNSNNTYRKNDKCTKANFSINFTNTNQNRHLTGYTGPEIIGGDYYFFVR